MSGISQFFEVKISSPKKSKDPKTFDATPDIIDGLKLEDEDGLIKTLTFSMKEGFTNMDKVSIGMVVNMRGGDLHQDEHLFTGTITAVAPEFRETGEVFLGVTCQGNEGVGLARIAKDMVYPSKTHPKPWGNSNTTYSELIVNLAKEADFEVSNDNIIVTKDRLVSFTNPIRQRNKTDWDFMQFLAKQIKCTMWVERIGGKDQLFLKDNSILIDKLAGVTLFYLARTNRSDFIEIPVKSPKMIQMNTVNVNLDTRKSKITQAVNPKTGKTEIVAEGETEGEKWILDEAKVRALPASERRELMEMFMEGKISWEGDGEKGEVSARPYFKLVTGEESSRTSQSNNIEVEVADSDNPKLKADGVSTTNGTTVNTGSRSFRTVINKEKVGTLSSEKRASLMGRIARQEMTEEDRTYYTVVDTTPKPEKEVENKTNKPMANTSKDEKKDKRDAGFKIECSIYGTFALKTKRSYVLEGLGKYSAKYYLYRIAWEWGDKGWVMILTFVK